MGVKKQHPNQINNFFFDQLVLNLGRQYKYIVYFSALLGINRLYMTDPPRAIKVVSYVYNVVLLFVVVYYSTIDNWIESTSYLVFKSTTVVEYVLLVISSVFFLTKVNYKVGFQLCKVDQELNILHERWITENNVKRMLLFIILALMYHIIEMIIMQFQLEGFSRTATLFMYIPIISHECEQIFFCATFRSILLRLKILKAHLKKNLCNEENDDDEDKLVKLSKNVKLDISAMHRIYENLYLCSEHLNKLMSFPVCIF